MLKELKHLLTVHGSTFIMFLKLSREEALLSICEILGLFINTLTADDKYFLRNSENLPQPIQTQIFKNQKTFSQFFAPFLKCTSYFKRFEKNHDPESLCIYEITDC